MPTPPVIAPASPTTPTVPAAPVNKTTAPSTGDVSGGGQHSPLEAILALGLVYGLMQQANASKGVGGGSAQSPTKPATAPGSVAPGTGGATASDPALQDLTYYSNRSLGGVDAGEMNGARAQALLAALRKYDPNARFDPVTGSDDSLMGYSLYYDPSKLPGVTGAGALGATNVDGGDYAGGSSPFTKFTTINDNFRGELYNPNAIYNSSLYGRITDSRNVKDQGSGWLGILGPALVGVLALATGGAGFLPSLLTKIPRTLTNIMDYAQQRRGG